jgi:hypothetical protein
VGFLDLPELAERHSGLRFARIAESAKIPLLWRSRWRKANYLSGRI